jgi:tetratricopeptide (TPR) repeat protein
MRKMLFALFVSFYTLSGFSQSDVIINTVTKQIAEGKYNDAERYLDSILKVEPKNIDALMMQGNVMLNYELVKSADIDVITPADESIFVQDIPSAKNPVVVVPKATALKIEKLWKQCLEIDGGRLDIRKGLCGLYGMAKMHDELVAYLPVISRWAKDKGNDFAFTLSDYATLLDARGDKEGAYLVYKKVAELYPVVRPVWCQLAVACYNNGDIGLARSYVDKALSVSAPDVAGCGDALDIYTAVGQPELTLRALQARHVR